MVSRIAAADEWYATLGAALSQGDIIRLAPYGLIDAPLTICQPHNSDARGKSNYYPIDQVPSKPRKLQFLHAAFKMGMGFVVWPDCQIDKLKNQQRPEREWLAAIAPVIPLSTLDDNLHAKVKNFDRAQWFPLPAKSPEIPDDSYIDLRHIWSLRYALLSDRIITLSEEAKQALSLHKFWFDTEVRVRSEVECPHCHKPIDSSVLFQYKEPDDNGER